MSAVATTTKQQTFVFAFPSIIYKFTILNLQHYTLFFKVKVEITSILKYSFIAKETPRA